jgi:hypothetical protein
VDEPPLPTPHPPGSKEKIDVLRERASLGLPLFVEGDAGHAPPSHLRRPDDAED